MTVDRRVKTNRLVVVGVLALVVVLTAVYTLLQKTDDFSWQYVTNTVLFSFLGIVNVILILSLLVILFRNLIRLLVERHRNILGSRFRTKLVFTFLGLCLIPALLLFVAAVSIIERSVDRWFSTPVERITDNARLVLDALYDDHKRRNAEFAADSAADLMKEEGLLGSRPRMLKAMEDALRARHIDVVSIHLAGEEPLVVANPRIPVNSLKPVPAEILREGFEGRVFSWQDALGPGQLVTSGAPMLGPDGTVIGVSVARTYVPGDTAALTTEIASHVDNYRQLRLQRTNIKRVYKWGFGLITLLILVSATWVGFYLARGITVPIQMLAEGTREVSSGNLDYQVTLEAGDELGILVDSFNRMTRDLKLGRQTIEMSHRELQQRNRELDERRRYIETVLESIPTGVISLNDLGRVTTINRAARRILRIDTEQDVKGLMFHELLGRESLAEIRSVIARLMESPGAGLTREFHVGIEGQPLSLSATFEPLDPDHDSGQEAGRGLLIVVEDITSLIKAQKVAAWREVARRMAHEIKNPLTPIQLSAQRMLRKWRASAPDLGEAVEEGTRVIVREVKALKSLVDEFSGFARLPAVTPTRADLHQIIDAAVGLYQGTHQDVSFARHYDEGLPDASIDTEQMKRVFVNLIDNALEAMGRRGAISIGTHYAAAAQVMTVEVADDGPGIPPEDKEKLFLPYFSTKKRGTGLGLAIVNRIISDHNGSIRVEDNRPRGTRFIIELPAA